MTALDSFKESVDVVLPLHGELPWVDECLESLAAQTIAPNLIIAIDDGVTDRVALIKRGQLHFGQRFVLIPNVGKGVAAAINTGVRESRAAWIMRMDGDDVSHKERLEVQLSSLRAAWPHVIGCGTQARIIDQHNRFLGFLRFPSEAEEIADEIWKRNIFLGPTMMVLRALLIAHPFRPVLNSCEDYDSALWLWQQGGLINLPKVLLDYRVHPLQQSFDRRVRQTALAEITLRSALRRMRGLPDVIDNQPELVEAFVAWRLKTPGYAELRLMLTALRYAALHFKGRNVAHAGKYFLVAARSAIPALPAYHRVWNIVRQGYAGLARESSPFPDLNI